MEFCYGKFVWDFDDKRIQTGNLKKSPILLATRLVNDNGKEN